LGNFTDQAANLEILSIAATGYLPALEAVKQRLLMLRRNQFDQAAAETCAMTIFIENLFTEDELGEAYCKDNNVWVSLAESEEFENKWIAFVSLNNSAVIEALNKITELPAIPDSFERAMASEVTGFDKKIFNADVEFEAISQRVVGLCARFIKQLAEGKSVDELLEVIDKSEEARKLIRNDKEREIEYEGYRKDDPILFDLAVERGATIERKKQDEIDQIRNFIADLDKLALTRAIKVQAIALNT
jgi:hypothetical protein